jgi:hypothetical protein
MWTAETDLPGTLALGEKLPLEVGALCRDAGWDEHRDCVSGVFGEGYWK